MCLKDTVKTIQAMGATQSPERLEIAEKEVNPVIIKALQTAIEMSNVSSFKTLIKDNAISKKLLDDLRLLAKAASNGCQAIVQQLIEAGAEVNTKDEGGRTALTWAIEREHKEIVSQLLEAGAEINKQGENGTTTLILAVENGCSEVVRRLLAASKGDVDQQDIDGSTALIVAAPEGTKRSLSNYLKQVLRLIHKIDMETQRYIILAI